MLRVWLAGFVVAALLAAWLSVGIAASAVAADASSAPHSSGDSLSLGANDDDWGDDEWSNDIPSLTQHDWQKLGDSHWIRDGDAAADRVVYAFIDLNCPFCRRFRKDSQPWVKAGQVQVRYILVNILRRERAPSAAAILAALDPSRALSQYESRSSASLTREQLRHVPKSAFRALHENLDLMRKLDFDAVPSLVVRDQQGELQRWPGLPATADLPAVFGPQP